MSEILRLSIRVNYAKRNVNLVTECTQSFKDKTVKSLEEQQQDGQDGRKATQHASRVLQHVMTKDEIDLENKINKRLIWKGKYIFKRIFMIIFP